MIITEKGKPKMKLKAAEGRYFLPILCYIVKEFFGLNTDHERLRYNCCLAMLSIYIECDNWDPVNSPYAVARLVRRHLIL